MEWEQEVRQQSDISRWRKERLEEVLWRRMRAKSEPEASVPTRPRQIPYAPLRRKTQTSFFAPVRKLRRFLGRGMEAFNVQPFFPMYCKSQAKNICKSNLGAVPR